MSDTGPDKILVIRNDKIGDFMLAWPSFALLKKQYPDSEIIALVPGYTAALAEHCEWIDSIIIDDRQPSFISDVRALAKKIRQHRINTSISLFLQTRTALALMLAGVSTRIGPASKIAQLFLNQRLRQRRSQSAKPEFEYNLDLIRFYIKQRGDIPGDDISPPFLAFDTADTLKRKRQFMQQHHITEDQKLIFIHPGSGGSAINLSLQQYADLAQAIAESCAACFVITAGPDELAQAQALARLIPDTAHCIHHSRESIIAFCKLIDICDLFISGSTGPLHIAGALDRNTAAFYPARQSATALRWQTLNRESHRLAFSPEQHIDENDMQRIDVFAAAERIKQKFLSDSFAAD